MEKFIHTDDFQYCFNCGNNEFVFIDAWILDDNRYNVFSGNVNLNDYFEEDIKNTVEHFYSSYDEFLKSYKDCSEDELSQLIAEMIFENNMEMFYDDSIGITNHGIFKENEVESYIEIWCDKFESKMNPANKRWDGACVDYNEPDLE